MSRRKFLELGGVGLAAGGALGATPGWASARVTAFSTIEGEFARAARRYGVPAEILLAMGYVNTRWEMPPAHLCAYRRGDPERRGSYGVMALVQNPSVNTLGIASRLTGISERRLKTERFSNILGGAALLASSQGNPRPSTLAGWYGAISGRGGHGKTYRAPSGVGGGELYASQVFQTLRWGASKRTRHGEYVVLHPRAVS